MSICEKNNGSVKSLYSDRNMNYMLKTLTVKSNVNIRKKTNVDML